MNTSTYPSTRSLRVEITWIILVWLVDMMSQIGLWKVIKERRELSTALQPQDQEDVEKVDPER